jgi:hypothetical protein
MAKQLPSAHQTTAEGSVRAKGRMHRGTADRANDHRAGKIPRNRAIEHRLKRTKADGRACGAMPFLNPVILRLYLHRETYAPELV